MRMAPFRMEGVADVAQLVEQLIRNQQVNGSSPFVGSIPSLVLSRFVLSPTAVWGLLRIQGRAFWMPGRWPLPGIRVGIEECIEIQTE